MIFHIFPSAFSSFLTSFLFVTAAYLHLDHVDGKYTFFYALCKSFKYFPYVWFPLLNFLLSLLRSLDAAPNILLLQQKLFVMKLQHRHHDVHRHL